MKRFNLRSVGSALVSFIPVTTLALAVALTAGCGRKGSASGGAFQASDKAITPATTNSFQAVARFLDAGGSLYLYLDTQQWLEGLSTRVDDWRRLVTSLPNTKPADRANLAKLVDVVGNVIKSSGVEEVSGVGASGILIEKGMYRNRFVLHHYPGRNQGWLWSVFGRQPHALTSLDLLPDTTALASFSDLDAAGLWKAIQDHVEQAGVPELSKGLQQMVTQIEANFGLTLDQALASLDGEVGLVLTLDNDKLVTLPQGRDGRIEFPEPALAIVFRVKNDTIFQRFDTAMQQNKQLIRVDKGDLKMRSFPLPFFFSVRPTVAQSSGYLFLSTSDKLVERMLAVKNGSGKSLKDNAEFAKISKGIPRQGNAMTYLSPEVSRTVGHIVASIAAMQEPGSPGRGGAELFQRLLGDDEETFFFSVASNTDQGWVGLGHSSRHPALALLGPSMIAPAISAGFALPALARAKQRAQTISCVNNLKQVALAARIYAKDHNETLPTDFASMKNELGSPRILICPGDNGKTPPKGWDGFKFEDASYVILEPGAKTSDGQKAYARCPIHGNVALVDGSVQQRPRPR